jgi:hypothetical protein
MSYFGRAALTWSATSESVSQRVHLLNTPLRELRPGANQVSFSADSLDLSLRETFVVGGGAHELISEVRYDGSQQSLVDLIRAGARGTVITYYPNLTDADTKYTLYLVSPDTPAELSLDAQRGVYGEQQVTLRFRPSSPMTLISPLPKGTDVLFNYRAGDNISAATFSRVTSTSAPATYPGLGYGTISTAKTGQLRNAWFSSKSSAGPRSLMATLLEDQRTNVMKDNTNYGTANWTLNGSLTRSSGKADPKGGTAAWRITASTLAGSYLSQQQTVPSSGQQAVSVFLGPSSNPSSGHVLAVTSSAGKRLDLKVSWSSGIPTVTAVVGRNYMTPERWSNGFYRFGGISASSAGFASGKKVTLRLYPGTTAASAVKGTLAIYGAQVE